MLFGCGDCFFLMTACRDDDYYYPSVKLGICDRRGL